MRPLEWLVFVSFFPALLVPFSPPKARRLWLFVAALLPVFITLFHLVVEGWRIQMLPFYGLALLGLSGRLPAILRPESPVRRRRGILLSVITALLLAGALLGAGWLLPVITLPAPTGPYAVGILDRELVDAMRGRRLMVSVWYPAAQNGTPAPLTHYPDEVTTALGDTFGLPGIGLQHLRYVRVAAAQDAPIRTDAAPYPVLVFSHGMVGLRLQNSSTLQDLASWGYVVVAVDHTDAAAVTVFPGGEVSPYNLANFGVPAGVEVDTPMMDEYVFPVWVADQRFVYDVLTSWGADDPVLAGKLDLSRIGSFGHSFGGATALEVCRIDPRCAAAADLDGALYGETASQPSQRPLLLMTSAESVQFTDTNEHWASLIANAAEPAYWLELPNSNHFSFTIMPLLSPLLVPENFDPVAGLHTQDQYLRAFFDQHLRGINSPLLEPASQSTDVRWLSQ